MSNSRQWPVKLRTFFLRFLRFFQNPKNVTFYVFLSGWPRFLEHWFPSTDQETAKLQKMKRQTTPLAGVSRRPGNVRQIYNWTKCAPGVRSYSVTPKPLYQITCCLCECWMSYGLTDLLNICLPGSLHIRRLVYACIYNDCSAMFTKSGNGERRLDPTCPSTKSSIMARSCSTSLQASWRHQLFSFQQKRKISKQSNT